MKLLSHTGFQNTITTLYHNTSHLKRGFFKLFEKTEPKGITQPVSSIETTLFYQKKARAGKCGIKTFAY